MFRIERATDAKSIIDNAAQWNALAGDCPFRESSWLGSWWNHFGRQEDAYLLTAKDSNDQLCGVLPLHMSSWHRGRLQFIGQGEACSDGLSVLCHPDVASTIGYEMGHWLASHADHRENGWSSIDLDGVIAGDQAMIGLLRGLSEGGAWTEVQSRMHTWFKPTTDTWDDFLVLLGRSRRRTARQLTAKLIDAPEFRCTTTSTLDDLPHDLAEMIRLHQTRWNAAGERGSFASERFRHFIFDAATDFFKRDRLRLVSLYHRDTLIASALQMIAANRALAVYSIGVDMTKPELNPGNLLNMETLQHAYEQRLPGIDYLRGDERYKSRLTAKPRRLTRVLVTPGTTMGRVQYAARRGTFELTQWLRRKRGSEPVTVLPAL